MAKKKKKKSGRKGKTNFRAFIQDLPNSKGNVKHSALGTVKDLVVGTVGGGLAGAAIGKPSLLVGIGTSLVGYYLGSSLATSFGLGMMASGGYQIGQGAMNGTSLSGLDGAKERMKSFGQNIKQRLYIDKFIKPKASAGDTGTNGLGSVQYFKYPQNQELDMSGLDAIEEAIASSGEEYEQSRMSGIEEEIMGLEEQLF
ncbi:MAG: hypothetical protein KF900_09430 [Bacteroidetes bacterium]|nr:hypothetical protein [Bacteroidota bacterium]